MVSPLLKLGLPLALDIEKLLSGVGGDQLHVMVADVIKSFDTVDRSIFWLRFRSTRFTRLVQEDLLCLP